MLWQENHGPKKTNYKTTQTKLVEKTKYSDFEREKEMERER